MPASSWTPGTFLVIAVRFGGLGEMTKRSVCGVKAKTGRGGVRELSAGVVAGLLVVRSALSKHIVSAAFSTRSASRARSRSQRAEASADVPPATTAPRATATIQDVRNPFNISVLPSCGSGPAFRFEKASYTDLTCASIAARPRECQYRR